MLPLKTGRTATYAMGNGNLKCIACFRYRDDLSENRQ